MHLWYTEYHTPNVGLTLKVRKTLFSGASPFQKIEVLETEDYGRLLLLDGLVMTTDRDEFVYHEMIVHPAAFIHPNPKNVLIIGGGDGGAVREAAKHQGVERVTLCEIDGLVVETCKEFFPQIASELEGNPKVNVVIADGVKYLKDNPGGFDLILVDSTDPIGPATDLFKVDFYRTCHAALNDKGILVAQSESPFYHLDLIKDMQSNLRAAGFPKVLFYWGYIPTYPGGMWSWVMASKHFDPLADFDPARVAASGISTRYYTAGVHRGAFALPAFFGQAVGQE